MSDKPQIRYGLKKRYLRKRWRDLLDLAYLKALSEDDLDFIDKFIREYYDNRFLSDMPNLHDDTELRRRCYSNENARNRDLWNQFDRCEMDESPSSYPGRHDAIEDAIIDMIDKEKDE